MKKLLSNDKVKMGALIVLLAAIAVGVYELLTVIENNLSEIIDAFDRAKEYVETKVHSLRK